MTLVTLFIHCHHQVHVFTYSVKYLKVYTIFCTLMVWTIYSNDWSPSPAGDQQLYKKVLLLTLLQKYVRTAKPLNGEISLSHTQTHQNQQFLLS